MLPLLLLSLSAVVHLTASEKSWVNPGDFNNLRTTDLRLGLVSPDQWEKLEPQQLIVKFDKKRLYGSCKIDLFGYSESGKTRISKTKSPFEKLNSGSFQVIQDDTYDVIKFGLKCSTGCETYHMGFMVMSCINIALNIYSPVIPLGWYVHSYYVANSMEKTWAGAHCLNWFNKEDSKVREAVRSLSCHPTRAYADASAAGHSFLSVKKIPRLDTYTAQSQMSSDIKPMQECYLSTPIADHADADMHASPTAECCYGIPQSVANSNWVFLFKDVEDPGEFLLHGSTAYRSHPFGVDTRWTDFYLVGQVPHLSHWYWDLLPYRYCCSWWPQGCYEFYHQARPTPKLQRPRSSLTNALLTGNFIVRPFSSSPSPAALMCNKLGTFWLVKTPTLQVQARAQLITDTTAKSGTKLGRAKTTGPFITGLAFKTSALPNLQFQVVASSTKYAYFVLVTEARKDGLWTERIADNSREKNFGYVTIGDSEIASQSLEVLNIYLTYKDQQLGMKLILPYFTKEFMSVMLSASSTANVSGLFADGKALSATLTYQTAECEKYAVPDTESLFVSFNESAIENNGSSMGKPATSVADPKPTKQHLINQKKLTDAGAVACLATKVKSDCDIIEKGQKMMGEFEATLMASDPKKDPFPYCTSLPNLTALVVNTILANTGLTKNSELSTRCPKGFTALNMQNIKCEPDAKGKALTFTRPITMDCKVDTAGQTALKIAKDWHSGNTGYGYRQHIEEAGGGPVSWRVGQSLSPPEGSLAEVNGTKKRRNKNFDDDSAGERTLPNAASLLAAAAAALCLQQLVGLRRPL